MIVANHQPQYIPYLGFFYKIARCDTYVVMDDVQFIERGHQHRNQIKMQRGVQWLTVPVLKAHGQLIRDVVIDPGQNWARKHWAALRTNYGGAPHFRMLGPALEELLLGPTHASLLELDLALLRWVMGVLEIDVPLVLSSMLPVEGERTERHISICRAVGATTYVSGSGGRQYMDLGQFADAGIEVRFADYPTREYPQQFADLGFAPNLSVVDALFNLGTDARRLLS